VLYHVTTHNLTVRNKSEKNMAITDTIDQIVNLTKDEKLSIEKYFTVKSLPKGELWIK
jgi:hypothetical protein